MTRALLISLLACFIAMADDFPQRMPNLKEDYRQGQLITSDDQNHVNGVVNELCAKLGIDNAYLYFPRYTNTVDYKVRDLYIKVGTNTLDISYIKSVLSTGAFGGGSSMTNQMVGWLYIAPEANTNVARSGGLRLFYSRDQYTNKSNYVGFQLYTMGTLTNLAGFVVATNLLTSAEFQDKMAFYGYRTSTSATSPRNPTNLIMALYAGENDSAYQGVTNKNYQSGAIFCGKPLVLDDSQFTQDPYNNWYTMYEKSYYYTPFQMVWSPTNWADLANVWGSAGTTGRIGSFLVFKPVPMGYHNVKPIGYEFLNADDYPAFSIRGLLRQWNINSNQYWVVDHHMSRVTGIPEPYETYYDDAVNLSYLCKEFDRKMPLSYVYMLSISPSNLFKFGGQGYLHYEKNIYSVYDRVYFNPVIVYDVSGCISNLPLHTCSCENRSDNGILFSFDSDITNACNTTNTYAFTDTTMSTLKSQGTNLNFSFTGALVDPYNLIQGVPGVQSRNECSGLAVIPPGSSYIDVTVDAGQYVTNQVLWSTVVTVCPCEAPEHLFGYYVSVTGTNQFRIGLDAPQDEYMKFRWLIPHVLTSSYSFVRYPRNIVDVGAGSFVTVSNGLFDATITNAVLGSITNSVVVFTPTTPTTNLYSWYQMRDFAHNYVKIVLDRPADTNLTFNYVIFKAY